MRKYFPYFFTPLVLVLLLSLQSCEDDNRQSVVTLKDSVPIDSISISEVEYAQVTWSNPLKIWEIELGLPSLISTLYDFSADFVQRETEQDLTIKNSLKVKFYKPAGSLPRPLLIWIHGGGYVMGHKDSEEMHKLCMKFAMKGYITATMEYRMMNPFTCSFLKAGYCAVQDAKALLRYVAANSGNLKVDTNNIFIAGISAGAVTALHAAFMEKNEDIAGRLEKFNKMYGDINASGNLYSNLPPIAGVINIVGGIYDTKIMLNNKNIPVLNITGYYDEIIDPQRGLPFQPYSNQYNSFIDLAAKIIGNKHINKLLEAAKFIPIDGSITIDSFLRANNMDSQLKVFKNEAHGFIFSSNGNFTTNGLEALDIINKFLFRNIK